MNKFLKSFLFLVLMIFVVNANATSFANNTPVNVGATATLVNQLSATKTYDVNFGTIVIPKTTATATMDKLGGVSGSGLTFPTSTRNIGEVQIDANSGAKFGLSYTQTVTMTGSNGGSLIYTPKMWAEDNNVDINYDGNGYIISVSAGEALTGYRLGIAGSLAFDGTEKAGVYTGTIVVNINWE